MRTRHFSMIVAAMVTLAGPALAQAMTPGEAISQNADKNGAFTDEGTYVTNGNVNFSDAGAMRSYNSQAGGHANANSAVVPTAKDPYYSQFGGTRVQPPGTYGK